MFARLPTPDLENPSGLAIDGSTLYVTDHSKGVVRGIELSKEQEIGRFGGLNRPHHLAAMSGSLLVTDTYNDRVICLNSELKEVWSTTSLDGHEFLKPHGVAANTPGEFYLANSNHNQLLWVQNETVKTVVGQTQWVKLQAPSRSITRAASPWTSTTCTSPTRSTTAS